MESFSRNSNGSNEEEVMGRAEEGKGAVVCVTGANGFIGSWLVMRLLQRGYVVRATVRNPEDESKTRHLKGLGGAAERLSLWKADLNDEGSFDAVFDGCHGVFHCATHLDFESAHPEEEVIKPTVEGVLNVMRSCAKAKSVKTVMYTSSAGSVQFNEHSKPPFDETCWTDVDVCRKRKMTGWMYFVGKTLAERAAWEFAEKHNVHLITVIPTLVVGPFISPDMPPSIVTALAPLTRNEPHYMILRQVQVVHLEDVCRAMIFLYEHPESKGRYIISSHDITIVSLAKMLAQRYKGFDIPTEFKDADESLQPLSFSSRKLKDMGFEYKHSIQDMYDGAIQCCLEKGLLTRPSASSPLND